MEHISQLLAMDVSAQVTMKDAAKCDNRCDWQNSANQENVERILHFWVIPESMSSSGLLVSYAAIDAMGLDSLVGGQRFCAPMTWLKNEPSAHRIISSFFALQWFP